MSGMRKRTDRRVAELEAEVERLRSDLMQSEEREAATGAALDSVIAERDELLTRVEGVRRLERQIASGLIQSVPKE